MAQATFTPVQEGDALNAATWNGLFTPIALASASIDGTNIRQEGVDRRNIGAGAVRIYSELEEITSANAISYGDAGAGATWAFDPAANNSHVIQNGASALRLVGAGGVGFTYNDVTQIAIITFSIQLRQFMGMSTVAGGRIRRVYFQLYRRMGGVESPITFTYREIGYDDGVLDADGERRTNGAISFSHVLQLQGTYEWIEARVGGLPAGNFHHDIPGPPLHDDFVYLSEGSISLEIYNH